MPAAWKAKAPWRKKTSSRRAKSSGYKKKTYKKKTYRNKLYRRSSKNRFATRVANTQYLNPFLPQNQKDSVRYPNTLGLFSTLHFRGNADYTTESPMRLRFYMWTPTAMLQFSLAPETTGGKTKGDFDVIWYTQLSGDPPSAVRPSRAGIRFTCITKATNVAGNVKVAHSNTCPEFAFDTDTKLTDACVDKIMAWVVQTDTSDCQNYPMSSFISPKTFCLRPVSTQRASTWHDWPDNWVPLEANRAIMRAQMLEFSKNPACSFLAIWVPYIADVQSYNIDAMLQLQARYPQTHILSRTQKLQQQGAEKLFESSINAASGMGALAQEQIAHVMRQGASGSSGYAV
jgi:hypothetical protein